MIRILSRMLTVLLACALLAGCSSGDLPTLSAEPDITEAVPTTAATMPPETEATAAPQPETGILFYYIEGEECAIPTDVLHFEGYAIEIPIEGWSYRPENGVERWVSDINDTVRFSVAHFPGKSRIEAMSAFTEQHEYIYEDLMGGTDASDFLYGSIPGTMDFCAFFATDTGLVFFCEFPQEAGEGFGAYMQQIGATLRTE